MIKTQLELKKIDLKHEIISDYNQYNEDQYTKSGYFGKRRDFELDWDKIEKTINILFATDIGITNLKNKLNKYVEYCKVGKDL